MLAAPLHLWHSDARGALRGGCAVLAYALPSAAPLHLAAGPCAHERLPHLPRMRAITQQTCTMAQYIWHGSQLHRQAAEHVICSGLAADLSKDPYALNTSQKTSGQVSSLGFCPLLERQPLVLPPAPQEDLAGEAQVCVPDQAALRSKDGVTLQEWDDAMTIRELHDKYDRCVHP